MAGRDYFDGAVVSFLYKRFIPYDLLKLFWFIFSGSWIKPRTRSASNDENVVMLKGHTFQITCNTSLCLPDDFRM